MSNKRRSKVLRPLTMPLILILMLLMFLMSYHDFDDSYVLMRNKLGKIIALHVGQHHKRSKTCVWVPKCLVTNLKGPNQTWVPKTKS
jgi:ABC-type glycerol-3-phosphate transport system permease component